MVLMVVLDIMVHPPLRVLLLNDFPMAKGRATLNTSQCNILTIVHTEQSSSLKIAAEVYM